MAGWTYPAMPARWSDAGLPTLVGRRAELAAFEAAWADVLAGSRQAVFIGGEPGAGKSRLLAEVATRLQAEGAAVLLGTSIAEFGAPYQPFVEPVRALRTALTAGDLVATEDHEGGTGVDPDTLLDRLAGIAGVSGGRRHRGAERDGETEYQREIYEAVVGAIRLAAGKGPVVLALEDLQWAGVTALNLLTYVVERTSNEPLLVVATHRTTAPDRSPALVRAIASLYRLDGVRRLDLAGLDTEDIATYLAAEAKVPHQRARTSAAFLRDQTGGNPFFVRELWREISTRGGLGALRSGRFFAPESVRDTLATRLDRLAAPHRQVLELAAVIGEQVDLATLMAAGEWTPDTTLTAIDEGVAFGLLESAPLPGGEFRFLHALARQTVLDLMTSSRLVTEHARVAQALEQAEGELPVRRLAHHYASARMLGYTGKAVHYLREAAVRADASLAHQEAAGWFEQAAELTEDTEQQELQRLSAARSNLLGGDFAHARDLYEQVSTSGNSLARVQAAIGYEAASWRPGRPGHRAVELLTAALEGIAHDEADAVYIRALASLGRALAFTGATEQAAAVGGRAVQLARRVGDDRLLADALQASLWLGGQPTDAPAKLARATELSRLADRTGDLGQLGPAAYFRGVCSYLNGDPAGWDAAHGDLLRSARVTGQDFYAYMAGCLAYGRAMAAGQFTVAESTCAAMVELGGSFGTDDTEGPYGVQSFMVRRETGALEQVRHLVSGEERPTEHWAPGLLALYTELGMLKSSGRLMRWLVEEDLSRYESSAQWPAVLVYLTEAALALGDQVTTTRLRPMLADYAGLNLVAGQFVALFGSADRYLGSVDSLLGHGDPEQSFAAAEEMDARMGATAHLTNTLTAWAAHLQRNHAAPDRCRDLVDRARSLAQSLGQQRVLTALAALESPGREAGSAAPDGLTRRETEVLRLVGVGLSNRAIARQLVISESTAANHVRSILSKTQCANRTQAAHYASSHGLLA